MKTATEKPATQYKLVADAENRVIDRGLTVSNPRANVLFFKPEPRAGLTSPSLQALMRDLRPLWINLIPINDVKQLVNLAQSGWILDR